MTSDRHARYEALFVFLSRAHEVCDYRLHRGAWLHLQIQVLSWENSQQLTTVQVSSG
jgi:hypothetical protein